MSEQEELNNSKTKNDELSLFKDSVPIPEQDLCCAFDEIMKVNDSNFSSQDSAEELSKARECLKNKLKRITKPVSIQFYNDLLHGRINMENNVKPNLVLGGDRRLSYSDDSDEESMDFSTSSSSEIEDDEMLLDDEALSRVKTYRMNVRDAVERTIKLRKEIPKLAIDLTLKELENGRSQYNDNCSVSNNDESKLELLEKENNPVNASDVSSMQNSLLQLSKTLQSLSESLPEKISGFQETTDIIQSSLEKHIMVEKEKDFSCLSTTERALFSKANDGRLEREVAIQEINKEAEDEEKVLCEMLSTPESKFTRFML